MKENKQDRYLKLVKKRKEFDFEELKNPNQINDGEYDTYDVINPWSIWQGNLDAKILLIGQDWGDAKYYIDNKGKDKDSNPTNKNLIELFKSLNIDIGTPSNPNKTSPVFFTNAILGIKDNGMSSAVKDAWIYESTDEFLKPLIEIIEPEIIITLGVSAFKAIKSIYKLKEKSVLKELIHTNPIKVDNKKIFNFYHCGGLGLANRSLPLQKQDWSIISNYMDDKYE